MKIYTSIEKAKDSGESPFIFSEKRMIGKGSGATYRQMDATVYVVWEDDYGISCADNRKLAERLYTAVKAGHPLISFMGRYLNSQLKAKGF